MNVLKKKYSHIQMYSRDAKAGEGYPLCFHYGGEGRCIDRLIAAAMDRSVLPHLGFSFSPDPPGRVIRKGDGDIPSLYVSNRLLNLGGASLIKAIPSVDMFSDYGLSFYRPMSVLLLMGNEGDLFNDIRWFTETLTDGAAGHPLIRGLEDILSEGYPEENSCDGRDVYETVLDHLDSCEELHNRDFHGESGYLDGIFLTADMMTSLELSSQTIRNIIDSSGKGLKEMFQIPLDGDIYNRFLTDVFGFDRVRARVYDTGSKRRPVWGVSPGVFGYKGALLDVAGRTVSGKRKAISRFLLHMHREGMLDREDLRYLI